MYFCACFQGCGRLSLVSTRYPQREEVLAGLFTLVEYLRYSGYLLSLVGFGS